MVKLDEQLEAARAKLAQLEAKKKAQEQRERAQAREKKRKAEVRAAIVMMALIRKDAETDESVKKYLNQTASMVTKPADVEALRDAGYLPAAATVKPVAETVVRKEPTEEDLILAESVKTRFDEMVSAGTPASQLWQLAAKWENLTGRPYPDFSAQGRDALGWPAHPLAK